MIKKGLDADGWPLEDQAKLLPMCSEMAYQVNFKLPNGRVRFAYTDTPGILERYLKAKKAKIVRIKKL